MSIINTNSFANHSVNGGSGSVKKDGVVRNRTDSTHSVEKLLEAPGQTPEAKVAGVAEEFKAHDLIRDDVVEQAKENLENGYYEDRTTMFKLAKTILDIEFS